MTYNLAILVSVLSPTILTFITTRIVSMDSSGKEALYIRAFESMRRYATELDLNDAHDRGYPKGRDIVYDFVTTHDHAKGIPCYICIDSMEQQLGIGDYA